MLWLLPLFVVVPIVELWLLLRVGRVLGAAPTIGLVLGTALAGAWLARREGLRTLRELAQAQRRGELPSDALLSGVAIVLGALLLLTPGFLTDLAGLLLLFPPTRDVFKLWWLRWFRRMLSKGSIKVYRQDGHAQQRPGRDDADKVYDAKFEE